MSLMQIIGLAINASMFLIVFALGLHSKADDVTYLTRHPRLFFRSILAMNVVMLLFAIGVIMVFDPPAPVQIALVALAVSPVPPVLPGKQFKAGGSPGYTVGLLVGAAIFSIAFVPLVIEGIGRIFAIDMHEPIGKVASVVLISVVIPLVAGIVLRRFAPAFAERIASPISTVATVLLAIAVLPVLVVAAPTFWSLVGNGVLASLIAFTLVGVLVGHLLGGPDPDNRAVLALATGTRHPGIAIAIASINFPNQKAVLSVVLFHLIIGTVVSLPYVRRRNRAHAAAEHAP
jgi:predicted Na+-dependent transporter